jgi:hypothetical protein
LVTLGLMDDVRIAAHREGKGAGGAP